MGDMLWLQAAAMATPQVVDTLRLDLLGKLALAILLGGAIGLERQISGKPAGLRTNILICMGAALLTDLSMTIGGEAGAGRVSDPARIAAQIVSGIGFIGAGTIMQARGAVLGLTTAATIWVVAAIGMTLGAGHYIEACGAGVLVTVVLAGIGSVEHKLLRARRTVTGTLRARPGTEFDAIVATFDASGIQIISKEIYDHPEDRTFELKMTGPARQFEIVRSALMRRNEILSVGID
jgi:putative Mg2+ transporter-C (MgtC) family protein